MSTAAKCDHCGALFVPERGCVDLAYSIHSAPQTLVGYSPDTGGDTFSLCMECSDTFLQFIKHDQPIPLIDAP